MLTYQWQIKFQYKFDFDKSKEHIKKLQVCQMKMINQVTFWKWQLIKYQNLKYFHSQLTYTIQTWYRIQ